MDCEGDIDIPADGSYTFTTGSDDGSRLWIDGQLVVDNDGLHGYREIASAAVTLSAGKHAIRCDFFENGGAESLRVFWQGPGIAKQVVPASALSHHIVQQEVEAVATAEAATESWTYYPAGHANQFLLQSHTDFKGVVDQRLLKNHPKLWWQGVSVKLLA